MSEPEHLVEARRWLRYAAEDLIVAERLLTDAGPAPRQACYLSQQGAEKALKAALISLRIEFPKTHDLDRLQTLFPADWLVTSDHPDLARLSAWVIEARYPGDWAEPTLEDAQAAVAQAHAVQDTVRLDLERHGLF